MQLSIYDYNRRIYLAIPTPPMPQRISVQFTDSQPQPIHITMPKANATIDPKHPTILIKENGNTIGARTQFELYHLANRLDIKIHPHTSKIGQEIIKKYSK